MQGTQALVSLCVPLAPKAALGRTCKCWSSPREYMAWRFYTENHSKLQSKMLPFPVSQGTEFQEISAEIWREISPGFGVTGGFFVRSSVPRLLRSLGSVPECPGTSCQYVKALPATFNGFCQIHKGCVFHKLACKNIHARSPFRVGNCVQWVEALWVLFDRIVAPVTQQSHWVFPHTRYHPLVEAEAPLPVANEQFPMAFRQCHNRDNSTDILVLCSYTKCIWWVWERHRCWFLLYIWTVWVYLFMFLNNFWIWRYKILESAIGENVFQSVWYSTFST